MTVQRDYTPAEVQHHRPCEVITLPGTHPSPLTHRAGTQGSVAYFSGKLVPFNTRPKVVSMLMTKR